MKTLLMILCIVAVASVALAEKPTGISDDTPSRTPCPFENIAYEWNFTESDWGFTTGSCDDGGLPTWEYGVSDYVDDLNEPLWVTSLTTPDELYPNDSGDSLISPIFLVDPSTYLVEVFHWHNIETNYDGGNLSVNGVIVEPTDGYPYDEISASTNYYAWCVDGEPGFSGEMGHTTCFDLSAFTGEEVQLSFDFGSDSSVQYQGWYIEIIRVGGDVVAIDGTTWSAVKGLYR